MNIKISQDKIELITITLSYNNEEELIDFMCPNIGPLPQRHIERLLPYLDKYMLIGSNLVSELPAKGGRTSGNIYLIER